MCLREYGDVKIFWWHCHSLMALQIPKGGGSSRITLICEKVNWVRGREREVREVFNSGVKECEWSGGLNSKAAFIVERKRGDCGTNLYRVREKGYRKINALEKIQGLDFEVWAVHSRISQASHPTHHYCFNLSLCFLKKQRWMNKMAPWIEVEWSVAHMLASVCHTCVCVYLFFGGNYLSCKALKFGLDIFFLIVFEWFSQEWWWHVCILFCRGKLFFLYMGREESHIFFLKKELVQVLG